MRTSILSFCSCSLELLAVLDVRYPEVLSQLPFLGKILEGIQQKTYNYAELFLESQIEAIKATKYSAKRRSGIFTYVDTFPRFISRIESILAECGHLDSSANRSRGLVNRYYERIGETIFASFKHLAADVDDADEKGHINASVMTIENSHCLVTELQQIGSPLLEPILRSSRAFYESSLTAYACLSIHRVLPKYAEYFEGFISTLRTSPPEEVAFTSAYSKASVKRVLALMPMKELRKAIDLLRQRVIKHFADRKELEAIVWDAVQNDFIQRQKAMFEGLQRVFPASFADLFPSNLAYSVEEVHAYFLEVSHRKSSY